jgi:hypothetical protein
MKKKYEEGFKAKVALEALKGDKSIVEKTLQENADLVFKRKGKKDDEIEQKEEIKSK